jgi:hypothetical protein
MIGRTQSLLDIAGFKKVAISGWVFALDRVLP